MSGLKANRADEQVPPMTLLGYWRIAIKRRGLIVGILAVAMALGALRFLVLAPVYASAIRLQIDRTSPKIFERGSVAPSDGIDHEFLRTQYELLQTRSMAERVVKRLALGDDPGFLAQADATIFAGIFAWVQGFVFHASATSKEAAAIGLLLERRVVRPVPGSRLVDVVVSDGEPIRAQKIAAAYGDAFIASAFDKRFEAHAYAKVYLDEQLGQVKGQLERSETVLVDLAQKEDLIVVNERATVAEGNLAAANATLGTIVAERIRNEQMWRQAEASSAIALPQFLINAVIEGLRARRNVLATEYEEKLETFKPGYPAMIQTQNKIAEIDRQIAIEVGNVRASLKAAFEASAEQETQMRSRIDALRAEMLALQKRSIPYAIAKRDVDTNRALYDGLLARSKDVDLAGGLAANTIFVADRAQVPVVPSSPGLVRTLLGALAMGALAAAVAAFMLEQADDTVRSASQAERVTGLSVLGLVPVAGATREQALAKPSSQVPEAYRSCAAALRFAAPAGLPTSVLVTGAAAGEGCSTMAVGLARAFAQQGLAVLLVDADLRRPMLHHRFGAGNATGLSRVLAGDATLADAQVPSGVAGLALLTSGPPVPAGRDVVSCAAIVRLMSEAAVSFDLVVIDGPRVMGEADALVLAREAGATVFVVAAGRQRTGDVRDGVARLQLAKAALAGCVLTKFDASRVGRA